MKNQDTPRVLNTKYRIRVEAPLLRPGLSITVETSERYAPEAAKRLLDVVRVINQ